MDALDIFAFIVMFVIAASVFVAIAVLGKLPGDIARKRGHPQAAAITVCGWLGIVTLGLLWPVAMIWAYTGPVRVAATDGASPPPDDMRYELENLKQRLSNLEQTAGEKS